MGWSVQMLNGSLHLSKKKGAVLEAAFINKMRFPAQLLFYNIFLFQFFNLHVLEPYFISVVLQKDVTFNNISKVRPVLILAISYQCIPHFIWNSQPIAEPAPLFISGLTKYLIPLFAPSVILKSTVRIKSL